MQLMRDVKQRRTWQNLVIPRDKCAQMARVLDVSSPEPSEASVCAVLQTLEHRLEAFGRCAWIR